DNPSEDYVIVRFDKELYRYLTDKSNSGFLSDHQTFLKEYGEKVIYIGGPDSLGFQTCLEKFFSEPTLMSLYKDEQTKFSDIEVINQELAIGLSLFLTNFQEVKKPQIYMHVSGLNQNVIVTDEILSISADKYLGLDYPLYQEFFYEYQRQLMTPDRMVPDYLLGFMMANLPFEGNDEVLLDCILYEGKLRYILSRLLPERNVWEYVGYNKEQYEWCIMHESRIWKSILENQHLFTPDYKTTQQYLREAPYTALLPSDSPGRVGVWVGYQIINAYMKQYPSTSLVQLMQQVNYQELLKLSKYKP
ncbi:MAG: gliding motility protein GldB, partial [Bacteroidales bacterium]|nr:gliding motility protein GldB [Bacteroidales bacterium]